MPAEKIGLFSTFKFSGLFWAPDQPTEKMSGIFSFDPDEGLALEVPAIEARPEKLFPSKSDSQKPLPVLYGTLDSGSACTLFEADLVHQGSAFGPGPMFVQTRRFRISSCCIGAFVNSQDADAFESFTVHFDKLEEWAGTVPINVERKKEADESFTITMPFRTLEFAKADLTDFQVYLRSQVFLNHKPLGAVAAEYKTLCAIEPQAPKSYNWVLPLVRRLQDFFSLCLGSAILPISIRAFQSAGQGRPPIGSEFVFRQIHRARAEVKRDSMVTWHDLREILPAILQRWLGKDELRPVQSLLLGTFYNPSAYVESQFLSLAQAIESMHRVTKAGKVSFQTRIEELLSDLSSSTRNKITPDEAEFATSLKQTRNSLTHPGINGGTKVLSSPSQLFHFNQRMIALLRVLLLKQIGVPEDTAGAAAVGELDRWLM